MLQSNFTLLLFVLINRFFFFFLRFIICLIIFKILFITIRICISIFTWINNIILWKYWVFILCLFFLFNWTRFLSLRIWYLLLRNISLLLWLWFWLFRRRWGCYLVALNALTLLVRTQMNSHTIKKINIILLILVDICLL